MAAQHRVIIVIPLHLINQLKQIKLPITVALTRIQLIQAILLAHQIQHQAILINLILEILQIQQVLQTHLMK